VDEYSFQVREVGSTVAAMTSGQFDELSEYLLEQGVFLARRPGGAGVPVASGDRVGGGPGLPLHAAAPCTVQLISYPPQWKINVIKTLRELTGMGLGEAKQVSENLPREVMRDMHPADAAKAVDRFREAGAIAYVA